MSNRRRFVQAGLGSFRGSQTEILLLKDTRPCKARFPSPFAPPRRVTLRAQARLRTSNDTDLAQPDARLHEGRPSGLRRTSFRGAASSRVTRRTPRVPPRRARPPRRLARGKAHQLVPPRAPRLSSPSRRRLRGRRVHPERRRFLIQLALFSSKRAPYVAPALGERVPYWLRDRCRCVEVHRNVQWFRGGLVFEARRLLYHSA